MEIPVLQSWKEPVHVDAVDFQRHDKAKKLGGVFTAYWGEGGHDRCCLVLAACTGVNGVGRILR